MGRLTKNLFLKTCPATFDWINKHQVLYNHNIEESVNDGEEGFFYDSLLVDYPVTSDNVFKTLIEEKYSLSVENKLRNDYESATLGLIPEEKKQPYLDFLQSRKDLHNMVENDCIINGIPL